MDLFFEIRYNRNIKYEYRTYVRFKNGRFVLKGGIFLQNTLSANYDAQIEFDLQKILENEIHDKPFNPKDYEGKSFIDVSKVKPVKDYSVVELFAGAGGLAIGLSNAGFKSKALVEIDKAACQTLRANRPDWTVIEDDIVAVAEKGINSYVNLPKGELDLLSGGYPCQSFSYAGKKGGLNDTRGTLFYYYAKILEELMPKVFLAENVRGLVNHDNGNTLKVMLQTFESIGYTVQWKVLKALDYDVAQKRERIIMIGVRNDISSLYKMDYAFPQPYGRILTLRDVLKDVPESPGTTYSKAKKEVLDLVPPGGYWRDLPEEIAKEYMGKSYYSGGGRTGMARRLSWDEPSLTLTCAPAQKQTERCHPDETRPFTVREYARIQSFPDDWAFPVSTGNAYKQIGNAVPVKLGEAVGLSLVALLNRLY